MAKLAIKGGVPVRPIPFPSQVNISYEEEKAVLKVLDSKILTGYQGNYGPNFKGGPEIQALEKEWAEKFKVKHAIAIHSATAGLHVALGAIETGSGDEVIVSPYSMTCSATSPMYWGAKPVFTDVEPTDFCISAKEVERLITPKTKAILPVSIFGQPYDVKGINELAKKHGLFVIEDAAQALGSTYKDRYAGTLGDIGIYSLNLGKHLTAGEGGMIVTDNDELAFKCRLLLNHAESVVNDMELKGMDIMNYRHMYGFNLRMTEISAAITRVQLTKHDKMLEHRVRNALKISRELVKIPAIIDPQWREGCTHSYYVQPFLWDSNYADGVHRDTFIEAVAAELAPLKGREKEGVPLGCGYIRPIYEMPIFQNTMTEKLPVVDHLYRNSLFLHRFLSHPTGEKELKDVFTAFHKVWDNLEELK